MCRTALRLVVIVLATFPAALVLASEGSEKAVSESAVGTYSTDDPVVKLALTLQRAGLSFYVLDENGEPIHGRYGGFRPAHIVTFKPDEKGRYSLQHRPEDCFGLRVPPGADSLHILSLNDIADIGRVFSNIRLIEIRRGGFVSLWSEQPDAFKNLKELIVALPPVPRRTTNSKPGEWTDDARAEVSRKLFQIVARLPQLEKLETDRCDLTDEDVRRLAALESLNELALRFYGPELKRRTSNSPPIPRISAAFLVDSIGKMKALRRLDTNGRQWMGAVDWDTLASLPHLETLNCSFSGLDDERLKGIEKLAHLKSLDLSFTSITGESLTQLGKLKSLGTLNLAKSGVGSNILALAELPNLNEVDYPAEPFRDYALTPEELDLFVRTCKSGNTATLGDPEARPLWKINRLIPGGIGRIMLRTGGNGPYLAIESAVRGPRGLLPFRSFHLRRGLLDQDLDRFEELTELTSILIQSNGKPGVNDAQIARFASFPNLRQVSLDLKRPVTGAILSSFSANPTIEQLSLFDVRLDEEAMRHIASMPSLKSLRIVGGTVNTAGWKPLSRARSLRKLEFEGVSVEGPSGARFRGIEGLPALESLTVRPQGGDDAECRWIGRCRSLQDLSLSGAFSAEGIRRLAPMPNLETLCLVGNICLPEPNRQLRVLLANPRLLRVSLHNASGTDDDSREICSMAVARELGIGMSGPCGCGCCDIEPDNAVIIPDSRFTVEEDRLVLDKGFLRALDAEQPPGGYNGHLRIRTPIRRRRLRIERAGLPKRLEGLYLNDCRVEHLEFVNCYIKEIGVFGTSDVANMHWMETEKLLAECGETQPRWPALYLPGVSELTFHSLPTRRSLQVKDCQRLRAIWLEGEFPNLKGLHLERLPKLRYVGAPYTGGAPNLHFSKDEHFFRQLAQLPSLRLLKMPRTAIGSGPPDSCLPTDMPPVHEIDLRKTQIGDPWLEQLAKIKTLRILRIGGCENLTTDGIIRFREARPEVEVVE